MYCCWIWFILYSIIISLRRLIKISRRRRVDITRKTCARTNVIIFARSAKQKPFVRLFFAAFIIFYSIIICVHLFILLGGLSLALLRFSLCFLRLIRGILKTQTGVLMWQRQRAAAILRYCIAPYNARPGAIVSVRE